MVVLMRRAARAAALAGALMAAGCATTRPGGSRLSSPPGEVEPGCVARGVRVVAAAAAPAVSGRAVFDFWVEPDGSPGPIESVISAEGLGLEGDVEVTNEVARAVARCRWIPATKQGRPVRALVRLPLRFAPSSEAAAEVASGTVAHEEIRPPREEVAGCVPRALPLPASSSPGASKASFLVRVEADGSQGAVTSIGLADLDAQRRRALIDEVAAAAARCRFLPGTVNGEPARTFWLLEVRFTGPAPPPAGPSP